MLWAIPIVLAVIAIVLPSASIVMGLLDGLFLIAVVADAVWVRGTVKIRRDVPSAVAVGHPFEVQLSVENLGQRTLWVRLRDGAPGDDLPDVLMCQLSPHRGVDLSYTHQIGRRGLHAWRGVTVRILSPLGLWERQQQVDLIDEIRVYPDFSQLRTWGISSDLAEQQVPVRARRQLGGESEFQRLRPYVAGDPYRHIDWKATARRREFVTREFGQESNQNVIFMLDAGRMMSAEFGKLTAFDHALNAALMMGQVALEHGDRVGLLVFDNQIRTYLPPKGGRRSGSRLVRATYDVFPSIAEPDYAMAYRFLSTRVRRRSLVVVLTAVVDEVNAKAAGNLMRGLGRRHVGMTVWLRDPALDSGLYGEHTSPWRRGAIAAIARARGESLSEIRRQGSLVVDVPTDVLTRALLNQYLEIKARHLL